MTKPILVAVHGMGSHTKTSFKNEVESTLNEAAKHYSFFNDDAGDKPPFSKKVTVEVIEYNSHFETVRERLQAGGSDLPDMLKGLNNKDSIYGILKNLDVDFKKDSFFNTHWLDVILYKFSIYGEMIRVKVAEDLVNKLIKYKKSSNPRDVHLLSHSLGTAVLHDTLHEMFTDGVISTGKVSIDDYQFDSLYTVSNVSRLIHASKHCYESLVKPEKGVCKKMINVAHRLDPISWPKRFDPKQDEPEWVSDLAYQYQLFRDIKTEAMTEANTHAITSYLANPKVYRDLFSTLFPLDFFPTPAEIVLADKAFSDTTLSGASKELGKVLKDTRLNEVTSVERLSKEFESFKKFWNDFNESA
jgi:hypothetical protein